MEEGLSSESRGMGSPWDEGLCGWGGDWLIQVTHGRGAIEREREGGGEGKAERAGDGKSRGRGRETGTGYCLGTDDL